jgi:hypothetical protein
LVASPYAKRGVVDNTFYTQLNVVKTVEQILGVAPMNQEDRAAEPMFNAFTNTPDYTPYTDQPNQVCLTYGMTGGCTSEFQPTSTPATSKAVNAGTVPASVHAIYEQWVAWQANQHFGGLHPIVDYANPQQLNRWDWYETHDWKVPYPGDGAILAPSQVPGATLPAGYLGG